MRTSNYSEGDWFAVPLRTEGFGIGLIARADPAGVLLGYFFGPKRTALPGLTDLAQLGPDDAVLVQRFGHLGLKQGRWLRIGSQPGWDPARWPMPLFTRYEELTGRSFRVSYDEKDPSRVVGEEQVPPGKEEHLPPNGLLGDGLVERMLTRILG